MREKAYCNLVWRDVHDAGSLCRKLVQACAGTRPGGQSPIGSPTRALDATQSSVISVQYFAEEMCRISVSCCIEKKQISE